MNRSNCTWFAKVFLLRHDKCLPAVKITQEQTKNNNSWSLLEPITMAMIIIQLLFVNRCSQTVMNLIQGKKILLVLSQAWDSEKF